MAFNKLYAKNLATASLSSDSSSYITVFTLNNTLPTDTSSGLFHLRVDDEILSVTDISGLNYYVTRAQESTAYAVHDTSSDVNLVMTAAYWNEISSQVDTNTDKLDYISVTQPVNLDTIESDTTTNNAKVTNADHSGDVTGSAALTIVPSAISGKTGVTPAAGDYVLILDADDNLLKKSLVDTFISAGGGGDVSGPASTLLNSIAIFDSTTGKHIDDSLITIDTSSNLVNGTGGLHLTTTARYLSQTALSTSGAVTWNLRSSPSAKIILAGDITSMTISEISLNSEATLYVKQDATVAKTIIWPGSIIWAGGYAPDISTLGSTNVFSFFSYDGTGLIGSFINDTYQTSGLINVTDTTNDQYFFGVDATSNIHSWSTGLSLLQIGEDLSISNNKALSNTGANLMLGAYLDTSGIAYKYTSTDNAQRINLNASTNQMDFYHCDSSSHVEGNTVAFRKRVSIAPTGFYCFDNTGGTTFSIDTTGGITGATKSVNGLSGVVTLVTGNISDTTSTQKYTTAADISKLAGIATGAEVNTVTLTNTVSLSNKRNVPRNETLTSGTSVAWNSNTADIYRLNLGHNAVIANDVSGSPNNGEVREFSVYQTGSFTLSLDTTSATKPFKFGTDTTSISADTSGKTSLILTQYDTSSGKWLVLSQLKGY